MKNTKSILNQVILTGLGVVGLFASINSSMAAANLEGSFRGRVADGSHRKIDLAMRPLTADGRDGAYLGVMLFEDTSEVYTFLIDPTENPNKFVMMPRQITEDGEVIGTRNPDPSLVLHVDSQDGQSARFTIASAHSSNQVCPQMGMDFTTGERSDLGWLNMNKGTYSTSGRYSRDNRVEITGQSFENETDVLMNNVGGLDGEYVLRQKMNGIYAMDGISYLATGEIKDIQPTKIIIFMSKASWFGGDYFVMINPNNLSCGGNMTKVKRI